MNQKIYERSKNIRILRQSVDVDSKQKQKFKDRESGATIDENCLGDCQSVSQDSVTKAEEEIDNGFDPKDIEQTFDGWELYKRKKNLVNLVKKYSYALEQDYTKHKVTVCAYMHHIYDLFNHQRKPFLKPVKKNDSSS